MCLGIIMLGPQDMRSVVDETFICEILWKLHISDSR